MSVWFLILIIKHMFLKNVYQIDNSLYLNDRGNRVCSITFTYKKSWYTGAISWSNCSEPDMLTFRACFLVGSTVFFMEKILSDRW